MHHEIRDWYKIIVCGIRSGLAGRIRVEFASDRWQATLDTGDFSENLFKNRNSLLQSARARSIRHRAIMRYSDTDNSKENTHSLSMHGLVQSAEKAYSIR